MFYCVSYRALDLYVYVLYSLQAARMDSVQRTSLKDTGNNSSQHLVTTSEDGHVLHFTLGTHPTLPSPDIPNIVNIASSTIPAIVATSQPVAIPYSGKWAIGDSGNGKWKQ